MSVGRHEMSAERVSGECGEGVGLSAWWVLSVAGQPHEMTQNNSHEDFRPVRPKRSRKCNRH